MREKSENLLFSNHAILCQTIPFFSSLLKNDDVLLLLFLLSHVVSSHPCFFIIVIWPSLPLLKDY